MTHAAQPAFKANSGLVGKGRPLGSEPRSSMRRWSSMGASDFKGVHLVARFHLVAQFRQQIPQRVRGAAHPGLFLGIQLDGQELADPFPGDDRGQAQADL